MAIGGGPAVCRVIPTGQISQPGLGQAPVLAHPAQMRNPNQTLNPIVFCEPLGAVKALRQVRNGIRTNLAAVYVVNYWRYACKSTAPTAAIADFDEPRLPVP
jgi:hypothetical protein